MNFNVSNLNQTVNPAVETQSSDLVVQQGVEKLQGYNAGFEKAISTFHEIILVLFLTQIVQVFTHRLLYRDRPFAVTLHDPFTGEEIWTWGSDRQLEGRARRLVKLIDQAVFTTGMVLIGFLFVQIYFPAYTWEVSTVWR